MTHEEFDHRRYMQQTPSVEGLEEFVKDFESQDSPNLPFTSVFFMPKGTVVTRNHLSGEFGGPALLAQQAFMVLRVEHGHESVLPTIKVVKFRGELEPLMESLIEAFMGSMGDEEKLAEAVFGDKFPVEGVHYDTHQKGCDCGGCLQG